MDFGPNMAGRERKRLNGPPWLHLFGLVFSLVGLDLGGVPFVVPWSWHLNIKPGEHTRAQENRIRCRQTARPSKRIGANNKTMTSLCIAIRPLAEAPHQNCLCLSQAKCSRGRWGSAAAVHALAPSRLSVLVQKSLHVLRGVQVVVILGVEIWRESLRDEPSCET